MGAPPCTTTEMSRTTVSTWPTPRSRIFPGRSQPKQPLVCSAKRTRRGMRWREHDAAHRRQAHYDGKHRAQLRCCFPRVQHHNRRRLLILPHQARRYNMLAWEARVSFFLVRKHPLTHAISRVFRVPHPHTHQQICTFAQSRTGSLKLDHASLSHWLIHSAVSMRCTRTGT